MPELLRAKARVQQHRHGAYQCAGKEQREVFGAVGGENADVVVRLNASSQQCSSNGVAFALEGGVAQAVIGEHNGVVTRVAPCRALQELPQKWCHRCLHTLPFLLSMPSVPVGYRGRQVAS